MRFSEVNLRASFIARLSLLDRRVHRMRITIQDVLEYLAEDESSSFFGAYPLKHPGLLTVYTTGAGVILL
jgi:hypothetical protein